MYFSLSPASATSSYSTLPMEIPSTSSSSRTQSPSCAFPSWPRRSSLSSNSSNEDSSCSSYISDEELFPCVFDDAEQDITPPVTPHTSRSPASPSRIHEARIVVDAGAFMRQLVAEEKAKKERRRRKSSKKSRSGSGASKHMSPILEAGE